MQNMLNLRGIKQWEPYDYLKFYFRIKLVSFESYPETYWETIWPVVRVAEPDET